jgi:hypothetical protein
MATCLHASGLARRFRPLLRPRLPVATFKPLNDRPENWKFGLAALALGSLFSLFLVETIPRLLPGLMPQRLQSVLRLYDARSSWEEMMRGDAELGFVIKPDLDMVFPSDGRDIHVRTEALTGDPIGVRTLPFEKPYDAIVIGDSFTFCDDASAEACWVTQLGIATESQFASLGVNGYSNLAAARMLKKVGLPLKPRVVLGTFFANDFKDNLHFSNWSKSGTDDYWQWMRRKRRSDASEFFAAKSILYRIFDAARRYGRRTTFDYKEDGLDFIFRSDGWWRTVLELPGATPGYFLTEQAIGEMKSLTDGINADFMMVLIPFKEQVYWQIARQYDPDGATLEEEDIDRPMNAVRDFLDQNGIRYCDLTGPLREAAKETPQLYLRVSAHWSDRGHAVAAQAVKACLDSQGLTPRLSQE